MKGYVLLDVTTREVLLSRNVVFYEKVLPYASLDSFASGLHFLNTTHDISAHTPQLDVMEHLNLTHTPETSSTLEDISTSQNTLRTSQRIKKPHPYLADYHCNQATTSITYSSHSQVIYPISQYLSYAALSPSHRSFSLAISAESEPSSYKEATKHACWHEAMKAEILALESN